MSPNGIADPGRWRTWLLGSGSVVRPIPPEAPTTAELDELRDLQARRMTGEVETVRRWNDVPSVLPWMKIALDLIKSGKPSAVRAGRVLSLLHTAMSDATVTALKAQAAARRPAPAAMIDGLTPLVPPSGWFSYPSEHAAVAGAAAAVLTYLFPDVPAAEITQHEKHAVMSRLWAGANYRSDIEAGQALGRAVASFAVARGQTDGSDAVWDGRGQLTGEGYWKPTPPDFVETPTDPMAGSWRAWLMPRGDAARPTAPPVGSPLWQSELGAVQDAVAHRTAKQEQAVHFWAGGAGTVTPGGLWLEIARDLIVRDELDLPHAARVLALTSVAIYDAFICCWDAKYAYWVARPITRDPSLDVLIPTPPFPSFTSGHSTISAAAATVLSHLFPDDAADLMAKAEEARQSRLWAGIHYPIDNEVGAAGGGIVGRLVVEYARTDGAG
jgi:membrane-associated phospholipid phosphatase